MSVATTLPPKPRLVKGERSSGDKPSGGPAQVLEGEVLEADEDSYDELGYACQLIYKLRNLLAFLKDPKLTKEVQPQDRIEMESLMDEIDDFLDWVEDDEEEEETLYCSQCEFQVLNTSTEYRQCPDCDNHPDLLTQEELSEDDDPAEPQPPNGDPAYVNNANDVNDQDIPDMNIGNCKNLITSSCVMAVSDTRLWCKPCKAWYAAFYYEGRNDGILANDGDLSPKDYDRLTNMVSSMVVEI